LEKSEKYLRRFPDNPVREALFRFQAKLAGTLPGSGKTGAQNRRILGD
jgi:hypothetical protein